MNVRSFVRFDGLWGFPIWDSNFWGRPKNVCPAFSWPRICHENQGEAVGQDDHHVFFDWHHQAFARNIFDLLDFWHSIILSPIKIVPLNSLFLESVSKISEKPQRPSKKLDEHSWGQNLKFGFQIIGGSRPHEWSSRFLMASEVFWFGIILNLLKKKSSILWFDNFDRHFKVVF